MIKTFEELLKRLQPYVIGWLYDSGYIATAHVPSRRYPAAGDDSTDDTTPIQDAIDDCEG